MHWYGRRESNPHGVTPNGFSYRLRLSPPRRRVCASASLWPGLSLHPRPDRHSSHPDHGCGEVDEAGEVDGASVVAGGETAEMLEPVETALDAIAVFVEIDVMRDGDFARSV